MELKDVQEMFDAGIRAVESGDYVYGMVCFEKIARWIDTSDPLYCSYRAVCLAREKGEIERGLTLCREAIAREPKKSVHYLNLGRVYLAAGNKPEAIRTFRDGLLYEKNSSIDLELEMLGWRRVPPFPSLGREHPLNKAIGRIFRIFGLR